MKKHSRPPKKPLKALKASYFKASSIEERNKKIYKAYQAGYSQSSIGITLGISQHPPYIMEELRLKQKHTQAIKVP